MSATKKVPVEVLRFKTQVLDPLLARCSRLTVELLGIQERARAIQVSMRALRGLPPKEKVH